MLNILCGKSGCGKDTLLNELKKEGFIPLISTTSRPMREGETNGVEYNFTTKEDFQEKIKKGDFIEYRVYNTLVNGEKDTWYYGMPKQPLDLNKEYLVILDMGGTKDFLEAYGKDQCFVCYIETNDALRKERASARGSFDETEWNRRLADDKVKFSDEIITSLANTRISNNGCTIDALKQLFYDAKTEYRLEQEAKRFRNEQTYQADMENYDPEY